MKWSKTKSLITLLVLAGLSLVSWTLYRYYNEQYYGQYSQYTGKAEIDDYEIIADVFHDRLINHPRYERH